MFVSIARPVAVAHLATNAIVRLVEIGLRCRKGFTIERALAARVANEAIHIQGHRVLFAPLCFEIVFHPLSGLVHLASSRFLRRVGREVLVSQGVKIVVFPNPIFPEANEIVRLRLLILFQLARFLLLMTPLADRGTDPLEFLALGRFGLKCRGGVRCAARRQQCQHDAAEEASQPDAATHPPFEAHRRNSRSIVWNRSRTPFSFLRSNPSGLLKPFGNPSDSRISASGCFAFGWALAPPPAWYIAAQPR